MDMQDIYEKLAPDEKLIMWPIEIPLTVFLNVESVENATELFFLNSNEAILKYACERLFENCISITKDCQAKYFNDEFKEFELGMESQLQSIKLHEIKSNDLEMKKSVYDCYKEIEKEEKQLTTIYSNYKELNELVDVLDQLREAKIDIVLQKHQPVLQVQMENCIDRIKDKPFFHQPRRSYQTTLLNRKFIIKFVQNITYVVKQYKLYELSELVKEAEKKTKFDEKKNEILATLFEELHSPMLQRKTTDTESEMLLYKLATMTIRDHRQFVKIFSNEVKALVSKAIYIDKEIMEMKNIIYGEKFEVKKAASKSYVTEMKMVEEERKASRMARMEEKFRKR